MSDILLSVGMQKGHVGSSQLEIDINDVVARISKNPPKVSVGLKVDQAALNNFKSQLTQIVNSVGLSKGAPITVNISGIGEITAQAGKAKKALDDVAKAGKKAADAVSGMDASKTTPALQEINRQLREVQSNYAKWTAAASGQSKDAYATYGSQIQALESLKAQVQSNTITWEQYKEKLSEIKLVASEAATTISKFGENHSARNVTILEHNTNEYRNALMQCNRELVSLKRNQDQWTAARSGRGAADYAALSSYQYELESLIAQLNTGKMTLDEFNARFTLIKASADNSRLSIRAFGEDTKSLGDRLKGLAEKFGAWLSVSQLIMMAIRSVKQMVSAVRDVDKAMTELKKVTDETSTAYNRFLDNATSRAKRIGASLADVVNASADFARLGYNLQDASNMADAALIYKNIGDGIEDVTTASESIISTMQAFGIEASDVMSIVDKFNEVGNNFAISSAGIGEAMQRSAAAMASANNTIEETIALITAANTIVQNPDSVGTTLKTVSMYLRAAKTEAEQAGESADGMADSVSELRDELLELTGQRVDIQLDEDTFKSTYQILKELSEVWNDLTDVSKANVLELVGGKRNANVVAALLENFSVAEQALVTASNAAGSAIAENAKQLESIEGKISKFKATFQTFAQDVIGSNLVKNIVDIGTALVAVMDKLQQLHLLLPTIVTTFVAIKSIGAAQGLTSITTALITNKAATDGLAAAVSRLTARQQARIATDIKAAVASGALTDKEGEQIITTLGLAAADGTLATANRGLATSFKALMASIPVWGWIALAITAVITVVSSLTDAAVKNKQAMIDSANASVDAYESANNTYRSNISSLENLRARFEQLSQGVDENGDRVSLTADEYEEYLSLVQQICNISPSVVQGYDNEGRAIVNYTTLLDDAIESQKEFLNNQRNIYLGKGEEIFDGKAEEYRDAQEKLADQASNFANLFNPMGFWESFINPDGADKIKNAYMGVFEQLGIDAAQAFNIDPVYDELFKIYERHDQIIAMLGETGAYTQDELNGISNAIYGLAGAYTSLNAIEGEQVDYLMEWVKDKDWYDAIPLGALDEMRNGIVGVNNPLLSFNDNLSKAEQYGKAFADAITGDAVRGVMDMSKGLADGSVSLEDYNAAVANLQDSWEGNADVLPMIVAFLYSLTNGYKSAGDAASGLEQESDTVADKIDILKEKLLELTAAYSKWKAAQSGPESGDIYDDSIQALQQIQDGLESGKVGTEKYKASVEFLVPEANREDVAAYVESLKRYISEDASGVSNFISDAITAGLMVDDGSGNISIVSDATVQDFCNKLTITPDMAQAIFGELEEYGWDMQWSVDDFIDPEVDTEQTESDLQAVQNDVDGISESVDTLNAKIIGDLGASETVVSLKEVIKWMDEIDNQQFSDKHVNVYTHEIPADGESSANGTSSAEGGRTLVGELGAELVVSGDRYYLVGQNGAEFVNLKRGDMVFNHVDTKKILDGKSGVRGQALRYGAVGLGALTEQVAFDGGSIKIDVEIDGGGKRPPIDENSDNTDGSGDNRGPGGGSSSSTKKDEESWFEKQLKEHQHLVEMDKESQQDYLDWLDDAYKKAYEEGIIDLDDFYKYEEEVYKGRKDLFKDHLNDIEHEISILEAGVGNSDEIINLSLQAIQDIEAELAAARAAGLDENGDYIQWLEQQWMEYNETVTGLREDAEAESKNTIEDLVEYRIDMLKQEIQDQKDALSEQLDDLKDFYDKQRKMLQDQYDEEKYLEEQKEKRKSVTDLRAELAMLESDDSAWAQKRKLELHAELSDAEKELSSFEKDHALDMTLDMLDEQQAAQEAQIQAQMDALDEMLNDPHALFNQALEDIKNNTADLYQQFIEYNRKHGTGNDQDIADMWEEAYKADLEYQDTHNGEHPDGIEIGNYTGYVRPETPTPPEPPEDQNPPEEKPPEEPKEPEPPKLTDEIKKKVAAAIWTGGYGWGNGADRVNRLKEVFGANNGIQDLVNKGVGKNGVSLTSDYTYLNMRKQFKGYASGTKNATPGWHELFEGNVDEYVFTSSDGNRYKMFSGLGDKVLNGEATDFLYNFATTGGSVLTKMLADLFGLSNFGNIAKPVQAIEIHSGDIIVQGNANERTVSEIRRAQRENLKFVITEFNKLNK